MARQRRVLAVLSLLLGVSVWAAEAPYPPSSFITGIDWDASASSDADGSDLWPMTWSDDGALYTAFGDGVGFHYPPNCPQEPTKLSNGWAKIDGPPGTYSACNIDSNDEPIGQGAAGKKAYGMLSVNGVLYAALSNANQSGEQCEIWRSTDRGINWTDAGWDFPELGVCAFLNFGQDYAGARDGFVYLYSPDTPSAYFETDHVILARVPMGQIMDRGAWSFFSGMSGGQPQWSGDIADRASVFQFTGGCNRQDVVYNAAIDRYLMTMRSRGRGDSSNPNHFSIYESTEPWGPWSTVYYTETSLPGMSPMDTKAGGWGESQHIPSKWISSDGREIHLVYAGDDAFRIRRATLTLSSSAVCGNDTREGAEECDGADLAGETCQGLGYDGGQLDCAGDCRFDASGCTWLPPPNAENLQRTDRRS